MYGRDINGRELSMQGENSVGHWIMPKFIYGLIQMVALSLKLGQALGSSTALRTSFGALGPTLKHSSKFHSFCHHRSLHRWLYFWLPDVHAWYTENLFKWLWLSPIVSLEPIKVIVISTVKKGKFPNRVILKRSTQEVTWCYSLVSMQHTGLPPRKLLLLIEWWAEPF